jgi:hypothetical protein
MGPPCFDSETFLPSNHVRAACSTVGIFALTGRLVIEQLHNVTNHL